MVRVLLVGEKEKMEEDEEKMEEDEEEPGVSVMRSSCNRSDSQLGGPDSNEDVEEGANDEDETLWEKMRLEES